MPESQTLDILTKIVLGLIISIGFAVTLLLFKWWLGATKDELVQEIKALTKKQSEMNGTVKEVIQKEQSCRENLPREYVSIKDFLARKSETADMFERIFIGIGEIKSVLDFMRGSLSKEDAMRGERKEKKKEKEEINKRKRELEN